MPSERIDQLLDVWMSERDRGVTRTITELCAECPELEPELSRRINVVTRFEKLADQGSSETLVSQGEVDTSHSTDEPPPGTSRKPTPMPASIGGFIPIEILGEGGMGAVYLAEDRQLGRRVAVKVMKKELAADPDARRRFLREARAMATIEHDNIMTIYAVGEDQDTPFLVMPVLKGETLDERLRRDAKLSVAESCRISREIADGLAAAHAHGLIHRDIKPSNIWLEGKKGRVRILDFGLARPVADDQKVTQSGAVLGTPAYMAPEQAAGTDATSRSDLFSLGALMYRMTTGEQPFAGPNMMATLNNLANKHPESPRKKHPEIPEELSVLIERLIAKDPEQRPESAAVVLESLQQQMAETLTPQTTAALPQIRIQPAMNVPAAKARVKPNSAGRSPGIPRKVIAGGLAGALLLLAAVVYRIQTDQGTLIVTIDDDQVAAKLNKEGLEIEDAKTGRTWKLKPDKSEAMPSGEYKIPKLEGLLLSVSDDSGTEFTTTEFKIKRGDEITVRVTLEPNSKPVPDPNPQVIPKVITPVVTTGHSPFDDLDPALIPKEERTAELPAETVAVLGSSRGKTWGSVFSTTHGNMSYSPDGKWICASDMTNVYLFNAKTLELRKRFKDVSQFLMHRWIAFSWDSGRLYVASQSDPGGSGNSMTDLTSATLDTTISGEHFGGSYILANSADDQWVAMDDNQKWGGVRVGKRDAATGRVSDMRAVPDIEGLPTSESFGRITELAFSPDGKWLITGHTPGGYRILRKQNEEFVPVAVIPALTNQYNIRVVYSFTNDHKVALLHGSDICQQVDLSLPPEVPLPSVGLEVIRTEALSGVHDLSTSADGLTWAASRNVYLGQPDFLVGNWVNGIPKLMHTIPIVATGVGHVALSPDGKSVAVMAENRVVRVFDLTQNPPVVATRPEFTVTAVGSASPRAVTAGMSGTIRLDEPGKDGATMLDERTTTQAIYSISMASDGQHAFTTALPGASAPNRHVIQIWEIGHGKLQAQASIEVPEDRIYGWNFLIAEGSRLILGNQLWDVSTSHPKVVAEFSQMPAKPAAIAVADDEQTVAMVSGDGVLSIYRLDQPVDQPIATVQLPAAPTSMKFSPDGHRLVTTHTAGVCIVWTVEAGKITESMRLPLSNIPGGMYHTTSSVFSRDGKCVYVGSASNVVEWKLEDNTVGRTWPIPGFTWLSLADDGRHLILNNSNCTTWILRLASQ